MTYQIRLKFGEVYKVHVTDAREGKYAPVVFYVENPERLGELERAVWLDKRSGTLNGVVHCSGSPIDLRGKQGRILLTGLDGTRLRTIGRHSGLRDDGTFTIDHLPKTPFKISADFNGYPPGSKLIYPSMLPSHVEIALDCNETFFAQIGPPRPSKKSIWQIYVYQEDHLRQMVTADKAGGFEIRANTFEGLRVEVHGYGYESTSFVPIVGTSKRQPFEVLPSRLPL